MDRTTIRLPKQLAKWAKQFATKNGQTFTGFLRVMLEEKRRAATDEAKQA